MRTKPKAITCVEAAHLKHAGEMIDVKVTIRIVQGFPIICIRDAEYRSFRGALAYLRYIAESEIISSPEIRP